MKINPHESELVLARQAAILMLGQYALGLQDNALLGPDHREAIKALIMQFTRLDRKEQLQREAGRKGKKHGAKGGAHGAKGGRPMTKTPAASTIRNRRNREKKKIEKSENNA